MEKETLERIEKLLAIKKTGYILVFTGIYIIVGTVAVVAGYLIK